MSIFTGQASKQAPHRLEAYGSEALSSTPVSWGESTAPIGPGYTDPYAWPPVRSYTGQTLRQAEQRMQCSADRPRSSASTALRPLSSSTRWKSCGPSPGVTPVHIDVYGFIRSPVDARGSNCRNTSRSCQVGTSFSTPITVIRVSGRVRHIRPLPSDSTTASVPVSATAKFAPEIATLVLRNVSRRYRRGGPAPARRGAGGGG